MHHVQHLHFKSPIELAHLYWQEILAPGDIAVDATCGNGHDTLFLSKLMLKDGLGKVITMDIQAAAIAKSKELMAKELSTDALQRVYFIHGSHETFPPDLKEGSVKLVAYNLGYLPGGDKNLTTKTHTTLSSIEAAQKLIVPGGIISITCYPGHPEGALEEVALLHYVETLPSHLWNCCHQRWLNRVKAPSLLIIQKR